LLPEGARALLDGPGLKAKAARGSFWLATGSGVDQALRLIRNIILTRLLAPEAFGLMAIIITVAGFMESFTDVGIGTAIVQNPRSEDPQYLNGAFWISVGRAAGLYALVLLSAPWVARFYHQPAMAGLMRVAFLEILFKGAASPQAAIASKKMDFKRLLIINQGAGLCGVVAAIAAAFALRGVWALVIGIVVEYAVRCALSYAVCPFRPGLVFHKPSLRELYEYSRQMAGLPVLTFLFMRADIFVIGKICSAADVGIYSMAAGLGTMATSALGNLMAQITGPTFSAMQKDHARLKNTLQRITSLLMLLIFPPTVFVALYGKELLHVLYGGAYAKAAVPFALLFGTAMLRVLSVPVVSLYFMIGQPGLNRFFAIVRVLVMGVLIYPAAKWYGLTGAASAGLIAMTVGYACQLVRLRSIIGLDLRQYKWVSWRPLAISLPLVVVCVATHHTFKLAPLTQMAIGATGCLSGYALAFFLRPRAEARYPYLP
jgi:O-antigen/teichoic acid export membrane protein